MCAAQVLLAVANGEAARDALHARLVAILPRARPSADGDGPSPVTPRGSDASPGGGGRGGGAADGQMASAASARGGGGGGGGGMSRLSSWYSLPFTSERSELTDAWQRGATSNFEYLMQLNTLSGRWCVLCSRPPTPRCPDTVPPSCSPAAHP